jgi:hypothetical protein
VAVYLHDAGVEVNHLRLCLHRLFPHDVYYHSEVELVYLRALARCLQPLFADEGVSLDELLGPLDAAVDSFFNDDF